MKVRFLVAFVAMVSLVIGFAFGSTAGAQQSEPPERIAFLARADNPVDALAASSVAAQFGGVVLLTPSDHLGIEARNGLAEYGPHLVILTGGTAALSEQVEQDVKNAGYETRRVAGASRTGTAREVAGVLNDYSTDLFQQLEGAVLMYPASQGCPEGTRAVDALNSGAFPRGGTSGASGGSNFHSHTVTSHSHGASHSHDFSFTTDLGSATDFGSSFDPFYDDSGSSNGSYHSHSASGTTETEFLTTDSASGSVQSSSHLPPYVNLTFCQIVR